MMAANQKRKPWIDPHRFLVIALVAGSVGAWIGIVQLRAATTERIVSNYHTGLAISGFDPVAYFTNNKAMVGLPEFETRYGGVTWRFINAGNREAFIDHPEVYMPVFGGYDPIGVARGVAAAGHPEVWLIVGERLYLFRNQQTRAAFAQGPEPVIATAQEQWPEVTRSLAQ